MPFFPVDDDAAHHAKLMAAGNAAVGLWARAGAWCMKQATGGVLQRHELPSGSTTGQARRLVEVALWHAHGHDCDRCPQPPKGGWVFHDWLDWGPLKSREAIKERRDADRQRQQRKRSRDRHAVTPPVSHDDGHGGSPRSPVPDPEPSLVTVPSQSRSAVRAIDGLTDQQLDQIRRRLGCTEWQAAQTVIHILAKASTPVLNPFRYVLAAVEDSPDDYRPTPGPPTKSDCCPRPGHGSYPVDNCGACRADLIAVDR